MIKIERTVEYSMSTVNTVVIPTAGIGSRMGNLTKNLNKALLPYKNKPFLSHIIDQFPKDTHFIIPVGYLSQQVKDYCTVAHDDVNITFVDIDDYTSSRSGTAYTLKKCTNLLDKPFWYIPCDTYFDTDLISEIKDTSKNYYFTKQVSEDLSDLYTMFKLDNLTITDMVFKEHCPADYVAFTGVMYLGDHVDFITRLTELNNNEFIFVIEKGESIVNLDSWIDFGNIESYANAVNSSQKFDFSKEDEITYITDSKVIKWWANKTITENKYKRTLDHDGIYPDNCKIVGNYLAYDWYSGKTLYQHNDVEHFNSLLNWLDNNVWHRADVDIKDECIEFYKNKTLGRIEKYLTKYNTQEKVSSINGVDVKDYAYYLNNIDYSYLTETVQASYIHGDLQFDNIVIGKDFKLIDWRPDFAGNTNTGDIYYDLAKLAGGFIINYSKIKENNFKVDIKNNHVTLEIPYIDNHEQYFTLLKKFVNEKQLEWKKVELLIPIIFWNMSPLHTSPFDKFLWYLGIKLFQEYETKYSSNEAVL